MKKITVYIDIAKRLEDGKVQKTESTNGIPVLIIDELITVGTKKIAAMFLVPESIKDKVITVEIEDQARWWNSK